MGKGRKEAPAREERAEGASGSAAEADAPEAGAGAWLAPSLVKPAGRISFAAGLALAAVWGFLIRLFSIVEYESLIHEFDPHFNFRSTEYAVEHGLTAFRNWFDTDSWFPLGRVVGGTVYPGIMVTAYVEHWLLHKLGFPVPIKEVCVFMGPVFSVFTTLTVAAFAFEVTGDRGASLAAAACMATIPGYVQRSVAGNYDNESISIFTMVLTFYLFVKALKRGSVAWAVAASLSYFYMVSAWGGYIFITNLLPIYVLLLLATGKYSQRLYVVYSTFVALGTLLAVQIPFVGWQHILGSDHLAFFAVFALIQMVEVGRLIQRMFPDRAMQKKILVAVLGGMAGVGALGVVMAFLSGHIAPFVGRFYFLLDPAWGRKAMHIIASVGEHQPAKLRDVMNALHAPVFFALPGVCASVWKAPDVRVFPVLFAGVALYFTSVMNRLVLVASPAVAILAGVGLNTVLRMVSDALHGKKARNMGWLPKAFKDHGKTVAAVALGLVALGAWSYVSHCYERGAALANPSIVIASRMPDGSKSIIDDYREAYRWISQNTPEDAKVLSWWDYGYHLTSMAKRTVLVDNNTWNTTHIAEVGHVLVSDERTAWEEMQKMGAQYVLVIFGARIGYRGDELNKAYWIVRITAGERDDVHLHEYLGPKGYLSVGDEASPKYKESLLYKLSYYKFATLLGGADYARRVVIRDDPQLEYFDEVYSSKYWIVRVYKAKDPSSLPIERQ